MKRNLFILMSCLALFGLFMTGCNPVDDISIPLKDFVTVTENPGYNGAGTIEVSIDEDKIVEYILTEQPKRADADVRSSLPSITVTASSTEKLSNGDQVDLTFVLDESNIATVDKSLVFRTEPDAIWIKSLEDPKEIDIFEFLEISLDTEGESPVLILENTHTEGPFIDVKFVAAEYADEENRILVSTEYDADALLEKGYVLILTELEVNAPEAPKKSVDPVPEKIDPAPEDILAEAEEAQDIALADNPLLGVEPDTDEIKSIDPKDIVYDEGREVVTVNSDGTVTYADELKSHDGGDDKPYNPDEKK